MGCPPDPMELSMYRDRDKIIESDIQYNKLIDSCILHMKKLESMQNLITSADTLSAIQDFIKEVSPLLVSQNFDREQIAYDDQNPMRDVSDMYDKRSYAEGQLKEAEKLSCRIMHFINYRVLPEINKIPDDLKRGVYDLKQQYLLHRKDDVDTWRKWLEQKRDGYKYHVEQSSKKDKTRFKKALEKVEAELVRISSLSEDEILSDRESFGKNPEYFEVDYN